MFMSHYKLEGKNCKQIQLWKLHLLTI